MGKNAQKMVAGLVGILLLSGCTTPSVLPERPEGSPEGLVSGIFSLGPSGQGLERCEDNHDKLCQTGEWYLSMEETWADPDIVGVYVRLPWESTHIAPERFDFTKLDHELDQAVKYGKSVSFSFSAGKDDIPDWVFTDGGVEPLRFRDGGSELEAGQCGAWMTLGDPTDAQYQKHYFDLLRATGEHVASNPDWLAAVAYVKLSGANLFTNEIRLPNSCDPACEICNTEVWAKAGYTPEGFYGFIMNQMATLQEAFPGKPMMYQLIQDGLPWMNNDGDYLMADGTSSGGTLIRSVEQVEEIIRRGSAEYGPLFVVAHDGLGEERKPNRWVVQAGKDGQPTAFQTRNLTDLQTPVQLQNALENLWKYSSAHYLEAYEAVLFEARKQENVLVQDSQAETNTLAEWNAKLQNRY